MYETITLERDSNVATIALNRPQRLNEGQALCGYTSDHEEGVAAFFEKRAPNFTGR